MFGGKGMNFIRFLCLFAIALLTAEFQQSMADTIMIATTEYPPYTTEKTEHKGFVNRLITDAFAAMGHKTTFVFRPWKRAIEMTKKGKYQALSYSFTLESRKKDFHFSLPIVEYEEVYFYWKSPPRKDVANLADLKDLRVGATRGYAYTDDFWKKGKEKLYKIRVESTDERNMRNLKLGRIEVFPLDKISGWQLINDSFEVDKKNFATYAKPLKSDHGYLVFPRALAGGEKLMKIFNEGLTNIKASGLHDKILDEAANGIY